MPEIQTNQRFYRPAFVRKVLDEDERTVELAFSSEEPVKRHFGTEILDHATTSVDLGRLNDGGVVLADHVNSVRNVVGKVLSARVDSDRVARAEVRFSEATELARDTWAQVKEGTVSRVSVGYEILSMVRDADVPDDEDGEPVFRVIAHRPLEISMVAVAADNTVGLGRSLDGGETYNIHVEERQMPEEVKTPVEKPEPTPAPKFDADAERKKLRDDEFTRMREINALGEQWPQIREYAQECVQNGTSLSAFQTEALKRIKTTDPLPATDNLGLTQRQVKQFSICRLAMALAFPNDRTMQQLAAFELEACSETRKQFERAVGTQPKGVMLPMDVMRAPLIPEVSEEQAMRLARAWASRNPGMVRALSAGTATDGAELVATNLLAGSFIDVLRNLTRVIAAGATLLTDLQGNVAIPRKTSGAAAAIIATETGAAAQSEPQFDQVTLTPRTLGVWGVYTRQLLLQSSLDIEALVRMDQAAGMALEFDRLALYGSGSSGQPTGIANTTGINNPTDFAAANPTFAEVVDMETQVDIDNAVQPNGMAYMLNAAMRGSFKTTLKFSAAGSATIWEPGMTVNGYTAHVTNQVVSGDLFFGYWPDLLIGMWGGLDVLADPYTLGTSGQVRIISHQSMDVGVRHPVSFSHNNDGA